MRPSALALAVAVESAALAGAQVFSLEGIPVPSAATVQSHYVFHVGDPHALASNGWGERSARATVDFRLFAFFPDVQAKKHLSFRNITDIEDYAFLHAAVIPVEDVAAALDPATYCERVRTHNVTEGAVVADIVVAWKGAPDLVTLRSGAYVLALSNCGNLSIPLSLAGSVTVRHPHGYLPALERPKSSMYVQWTGIYLLSSSVWSFFLVRERRPLLPVHRLLWIVNVAALVECLAWLLVYSDWNATGTRDQTVHMFAMLCSAGKVYLCFNHLIFVGVVPGMPRDSDSLCTEYVQPAALTAWLVSHMYYWWEYALRAVQGRRTWGFVRSSLPFLVLTALLTWWCAGSLATAAQALEACGRARSAAVVRQTLFIVFAGGSAGLAVCMLQIVDPTIAGDAGRWGTHAVLAGALPQGVFAAALFSAMWVWRPTEGAESSARATFGAQKVHDDATLE